MKIKDFKVLSDSDSPIVVTFKIHRFLRKPKQHVAFNKRYDMWVDTYTRETFPIGISLILSDLYEASKCSQVIQVIHR